MAERTQLKTARDFGDAGDDPFAELTKIMGFDPRQPVRREPVVSPVSQVAPAPVHSSDSFDESEFGIDLERELLGDFANDAYPVAPVRNSQTQQAVAPIAAQYVRQAGASHLHALEPEFAPLDETPGQGVQHHDARGMREQIVHAYGAQDNADDFDFALSESLGQELGREDFDAQAQGDARYADDGNIHAGYVQAGPDTGYADAAELADDDFGRALAVSMEEDLVLTDEDAHVVNEDGHLAADGAAPRYYEASEAAEEELSLDGSWLTEEDAEQTASADFEYRDGPAQFSVQPNALPEDFDSQFDSALAQVDMDFGAESHGAVTDSIEEEVHAVPSEMSLEDELNALLAGEEISSSGAYYAEAAAAIAYDAHEYAPVEELEVAEPGKEFEHSMADAFSAEDDDEEMEPLSYEAEIRPDTSYQPDYSFGPTYEVEFDGNAGEESDIEGDERYEMATADLASIELDSHEGDDDQAEAADPVLFDEAAFHAELESDFVEHEEQAPAPEPVRQQARQQEDDDPFAALMALATSFKPGGFSNSHIAAQPVAPVAPAPVEPEPVEAEAEAYQPEAYEAGYYDEQDDYAASEEVVPDIETIEVPEAVALAEDLDIPEVAFEEDKPSGSAYDDLDAEFANLLSDMTAPEAPEQPKAAAPVQVSSTASQGAYPAPADEADYDDQEQAYAAAAAAAAVAGTVYATTPSRQPAAAPVMQATHGQAQYRPAAAAQTRQDEPTADDEFEFDHEAFQQAFDNEAVAPGYAKPAYVGEKARPRLSSRGYILAAVVGGVALLGGVSVFALSSGGGSTGPALVMAEDGPIKIKPENPGGTAVRNQQNMVYDTVARAQGGGEAAPVQEKLVSTAEEPVDVQGQVAAQQAQNVQPEMADGNSAIEDMGVDEGEQEAGPSISQLAGVENPQLPTATPSANEMAAAPQPLAKAEDRITPADIEEGDPVAEEIAAVAPRKVRTLVVRPDGTLVPREEPAPAAAQVAPSQDAASAQPANAAPAAAQPNAVPAQPQQVAALDQAAAGGAQGQTPARAPVAPSRPADQPVDIVGAVKAQNQVAALNGNAAAASGEWSVQIASQPSEAAARASFNDLSRRYGSVLNGRNVNIVRADIEGKGTFWRVRLPADSRGEAVNLCNSYKAAGGNCFVSR